MIESSSQDRVPSKKRVNKGGQKSIVQLFPNIIDITIFETAWSCCAM